MTAPKIAPATAGASWTSGSSAPPTRVCDLLRNSPPMIDNMTMANIEMTMHDHADNAEKKGFIVKVFGRPQAF